MHNKFLTLTVALASKYIALNEILDGSELLILLTGINICN